MFNGGAMMVTLQLSTEEADVLASMLKYELSDLRLEISATDRKEWRDEMKQREHFINQLIGQLAVSAA
jgi:hypothetical protein